VNVLPLRKLQIGADGIKIEMGLMPAKDGNNYGFEYIHRPGSENGFERSTAAEQYGCAEADWIVSLQEA
jgi:hypothetical protein